MNSSKSRSGNFDLEIYKETILQLQRLGGLRLIVFAGGEPTLTKNSLFEAISFARDRRLATRMVTNASWAITEEKAAVMLERLKKAGLNELNISFDDYHLPYISELNVVNAGRQARQMNFTSVIIANASDSRSMITPEYIEKLLGEKLPRRFDDETGENLIKAVKGGKQYFGVSNCSLMYLGRGQGLRGVTERKPLPNNASLMQPCPNVMRSPAITPDNHLVGCCGFELKDNDVLNFGSTASREADGLWCDAVDDIFVRAISQLGPGFLLRYAASKDPTITVREDYLGICEVCQDVTTNSQVLRVLEDNLEEIATILYNIQRRESGVAQVKLDA